MSWPNQEYTFWKCVRRGQFEYQDLYFMDQIIICDASYKFYLEGNEDK